MAITASIVVATIAVVGMQVALAASPVPVVVSFTATKTTIPDTGARIVLKASIKYASSCEITVSPSLPGFPKSFSCSSDRVMQSVTLRANKTGNPITYSFGMAVKNSTGSITATNVAVTEDAALPIPVPVVVSFTATKTTIPDTGARIVLKASIKVTVTNNSSATQDIASAAISTVADSADFGLTMNNCANVTPHASCSLAIQFRPSGAGIRTGAVSVVDASWGASGTTIQLNLSGTGVWATATVSSAYIHDNALIFPTSQVLLTQSPIQPVTLTNVGTVPLYISPYSPPSTPPTGIAITGGDVTDFTATLDTCSNQINAADPLIVSVGQSCTFEVGFEPSGTGTRTSYVVLADNTLGGETQLQLKGVGIAKPA
jgi:signal peptidase I